jgi:outer membrane protein assembly factor BamA
MYWTRLIIVVPVAILAVTLCLSQNSEGNPAVLLKQVNFRGDLGIPVDDLRAYTEFLSGHRLGRKKLLEDASSAVGNALRHRGYFKAKVTPQLRSLKASAGSSDAEVALELIIQAGKQYRVKDLTFAGLSSQLSQGDLRHSCDIRSGEIADGERASSCITNLTNLFHRKGQEVFVVPSMMYDDAASTVSFQFDVQK